uniref:Nucleoporin kDa37 n=1 Tax=Triatoma infestans TaxID=30076 RepID=A0A161M316_TRIIF
MYFNFISYKTFLIVQQLTRFRL